jgi:hypothetical protein
VPESVTVLENGDLDVAGVGRISFGFTPTDRGEFAVGSRQIRAHPHTGNPTHPRGFLAVMAGGGGGIRSSARGDAVTGPAAGASTQEE